MNYWLMKSEPGSWSWEDQLKVDKEGWDGVRNYQAANNMKAMKTGDRAFFYHSVKEKSIVGIVEIVDEYHPDPTDKSERFGMVSVRAVETVPNPVSLADIKSDPRLSELSLLKQSRLSVMPIDAKSWKIICGMGGVKT